MKLFLDTSTNVCKIKLDSQEYSWDAGHEMAEKIFTFIHDKLLENHAD